MNKLLGLHNHACRTYKGFYPNITPVIYNLSQETSHQGEYALVYITGNNFLLDGMTRVNFGTYTLPVTFSALLRYHSLSQQMLLLVYILSG